MFPANEISLDSIIILGENGFPVKSIQEDPAGISDQEVIKIAAEMDSTILTFDRD